MGIKHWFIRIFLPLVWRISKRRKCAALQEIALTEFDSAWQSLYAMQYIDDPRTQAVLFRHALEELHHADLFRDLSLKYSDAPLNVPVFTREILLDPDGGRESVIRFLASVHVGERDVNGDFAAYASARVDSEISEVFKAIQRDEKHHEEASMKTLIAVSGLSPRAVRWLLLRTSLVRRYQFFSRVMSGLGEYMLVLPLGLVYFVLGLLVSGTLQRRLRLPRREQLKIVELQYQDSAGGIF